MNISLLKKIFDLHLKTSRSLLLGFSGGPDSLALLHLLLEFKEKENIDLALAHIDHGWRPESQDEAIEIKNMAISLGIKLHIRKLDPNLLKGNLEASCREERLKYFLDLCQEYKYDALLLGHHADDQAETVLKRIFEGASIAKLKSIQEMSIYRDPNSCVIREMKILRPLLKVTKKEILIFLEKRNLVGFYDKTNDDSSFLRARLRKNILPYLNEVFGKEISQNLRHLSEESNEIREHLEEKLLPILKTAIRGLFGVLLDLKELITAKDSIRRYELKYLLKRFSENEGFFLSRAALDQAVVFLLNGAADKQITSGEKSLFIDRMSLFLISSPLPILQNENFKITFCKVLEIKCSFSRWHVSVERVLGDNFKLLQVTNHWKNVWQGKVECILPIGDYELSSPKPTYRLDKNENTCSKNLDKLWSDEKVPSILRNSVPVILKDNLIAYEFLSGTKNKEFFEKYTHYEELCLVRLTFL